MTIHPPSSADWIHTMREEFEILYMIFVRTRTSLHIYLSCPLATTEKLLSFLGLLVGKNTGGTRRGVRALVKPGGWIVEGLLSLVGSCKTGH